jgi:hypothetical protein
LGWRLRKFALRCFGLAAVLSGAALAALLFADELVRIGGGNVVESPIPMPQGVQIMEAPRLVRAIGGVVGGAAAVTVGRTILVPSLAVQPRRRNGTLVARDTLFVSAAAWRNILWHERTHVLQRERYGRWYLPLYVYWFARTGYGEHPFEREARVSRPHPTARNPYGGE